MESKPSLCRTHLEEVESQLITLAMRAGNDAALATQIANALGYIRKVIVAIGPENRRRRKISETKKVGGVTPFRAVSRLAHLAQTATERLGIPLTPLETSGTSA